MNSRYKRLRREKLMAKYRLTEKRLGIALMVAIVVLWCLMVS